MIQLLASVEMLTARPSLHAVRKPQPPDAKPTGRGTDSTVLPAL